MPPTGVTRILAAVRVFFKRVRLVTKSIGEEFSFVLVQQGARWVSESCRGEGRQRNVQNCSKRSNGQPGERAN